MQKKKHESLNTRTHTVQLDARNVRIAPGTLRSATRQADLSHTESESRLRPEIAPCDPHVRPVRRPASHLADLQLVHCPRAKIKMICASTTRLGLPRERREREGDAFFGATPTS